MGAGYHFPNNPGISYNEAAIVEVNFISCPIHLNLSRRQNYQPNIYAGSFASDWFCDSHRSSSPAAKFS